VRGFPFGVARARRPRGRRARQREAQRPRPPRLSHRVRDPAKGDPGARTCCSTNSQRLLPSAG